MNNLRFNPESKDKKKIKEEFIPILFYNDDDKEDEFNYIKSFINQDFIKIVIAKYFKNIKEYYYFENQEYYKEIINKLNIDFYNKGELIRNHIYTIYEKMTIDYLNNLLYTFIYKVFENATKKKLNVSSIDEINNIISIYNPIVDYEFNQNSLNSDLIKNINKDNLQKYQESINNNANLNFSLIDDEDYDLVENLKDNLISFNKKNYPIFYSYNYNNYELKKECVIIDYQLIELLLQKGADYNIKDQAGKTIIDYIIEAKMFYLLDNEKIKNRIFKPNILLSLIKIIKIEKIHNNIFYYNKIILIEDYAETFIKKLKNIDELKANIPIKIKNIFAMFFILQNIYWYRFLNKTFYNDPEYLNFFNIKYNNNNNLDINNDWKTILSDVNINIEINTNKLLEKQINKFEKTKNILNKQNNKKIDNKIILLKQLTNVIKKIETIKVNNDFNISEYRLIDNENILDEDKSIKYFRDKYNRLNKNNQSLFYIYIWDMIISDIDKPFYIYLTIFKKYQETLSLDININTKLSESTFFNFKKNINNMIKYIEPISTFIDYRISDSILTENNILLFQVRTITHILSTVLGTNMILLLEKILFVEFKNKFLDIKDEKIIYNNVRNVMKDVNKYICSDLLEYGNLSFEFLKIHIGFRISYNDMIEDKTIDEIFETIITKLLAGKINRGNIDVFSSLEEKTIIIDKIRTNILPYYLILYKETTNQLLNFSDSYYRYIKNQYSMLLLIQKIIN